MKASTPQPSQGTDDLTAAHASPSPGSPRGPNPPSLASPASPDEPHREPNRRQKNANRRPSVSRLPGHCRGVGSYGDEEQGFVDGEPNINYTHSPDLPNHPFSSEPNIIPYEDERHE